MTNNWKFSFDNFAKENTPKWAKQLGRFFLILGGIFGSVGAFLALFPSDIPFNFFTPSDIAEIHKLGILIGFIGGNICGAAKFLLDCIGVPLKNLQ